MRNIKNVVVWALIIVMSMTLLTGCGSSTPAATETPAAPAATEAPTATEAPAAPAEPAGPVELVIGIPDSVQALDPMNQQNTTYGGNAIGQVFDTLVANNFETTEIVPCLAESWDISPDGLVYTFHLRDDVYFHPGQFQDGRQMVASDVVYTFNRIDELFARNRAQVDNIVSVEATDDFTVVMTLEKADSQTLAVITQENFGIVPQEEVEGQGDAYGANAIGTGPFMVEELSEGNYVKLVKNEKYWGTVPAVDVVTFQFISDANTMANALRSGEIDVAASLNADFISVMEGEENITVVNTSMRQHVALLHMNMVNGPTADPKVREAIIKAIDIDAMVEGIYLNKDASRTYLPAPKCSWGYDESLESLVPSYDPEGAKALLAEAGYPDGLELNLYISSTAARNRMATIVQQQLKENLNITLNIHASDWAAFSEVVCAGKADIYGASFAFSESGDPYFYLNGFYNTSSIGSSPNGGGYSNADVDALLAESVNVTDQDERAKIYSEIMTTVLNDYVGIYYANENLIYAYNNNVEGFRINPSTIFWLNEVSMKG